MFLEASSQEILFGHNKIFDILKKLYLNEKLPNKFIFSGEKGIGKCTLAYHLINYILSSNENYFYDTENYKINNQNKSFKLIQNKSHPNFNLIDVEQGKKKIDINQIRDLITNLNKSSLNSKPRFVLIDNIELLNLNSINALLKIIEEPNDNIHFILINNYKRILPTLKSRCINFKITLSRDKAIQVTNNIIKDNIYNLCNSDLIYHYITPGQLLNILKFSTDYEINIKNSSLKFFLSSMLKNKSYKKNRKLGEFIFSLIELYFRKNISVQNNEYFKFYNYFLKKINNTKIYNLDEESLFMEFEDTILNG